MSRRSTGKPVGRPKGYSPPKKKKVKPEVSLMTTSEERSRKIKCPRCGAMVQWQYRRSHICMKQYLTDEDIRVRSIENKG